MIQLTPFIDYLKYEKRASEHTIKAYQSDISKFFIFLNEHYDLDVATCNIHQLESEHIKNWIFFLIEKDQNSSKSINRKISSLKAFFKFNLKSEIIKDDPTKPILSQKVSKRVPKFVEMDDMNKLFTMDLFEDNFEGWRDRAILELFYATGMRLSELLHLTRSDFDLYSQNVKVLGKRNKERIIPFGNQAKKTIEKYFSVFEQKFGEMSQKSCIFVTLKNNKLNPKSVYRIVRRYLDMITTIDKRSPHIIRHTFATHLLNNGADINAIKEILGHSSLAATQIYTHNTIDKLKSIYQQAHPRA